jgi:hypothetical protein
MTTATTSKTPSKPRDDTGKEWASHRVGKRIETGTSVYEAGAPVVALWILLESGRGLPWAEQRLKLLEEQHHFGPVAPGERLEPVNKKPEPKPPAGAAGEPEEVPADVRIARELKAAGEQLAEASHERNAADSALRSLEGFHRDGVVDHRLNDQLSNARAKAISAGNRVSTALNRVAAAKQAQDDLEGQAHKAARQAEWNSRFEQPATGATQ